MGFLGASAGQGQPPCPYILTCFVSVRVMDLCAWLDGVIEMTTLCASFPSQHAHIEPGPPLKKHKQAWAKCSMLLFGRPKQEITEWEILPTQETLNPGGVLFSVLRPPCAEAGISTERRKVTRATDDDLCL